MAGPTTAFQTGVHASRPAASAGCILYSCTTHSLIYRSDGSSWTTYATLGSVSTTVATDPIWDAAGDLVQGTGADTAAKLSAGSASQVLTSAGAAAANTWKYPPGYEFDYVQYTSDVAISANTEATANTIVTSNAVSYDGSTIVLIQFFAGAAYGPATATVDITFALYDGSSSIGLFGNLRSQSTSRGLGPIKLERRLTPSNASHTYSVRAYVGSGGGASQGGAGGSGNLVPGFIRITKV